MFEAKLENSRGNMITLTGNEGAYQILSITGLNPPSAKLNTTAVAGMDGDIFNSARLNTRNIVITAKINGDVEENRQNLYRHCPTKEKVRFFFKNNSRDVYIDGYVENVECDLFTNDERMQISIICPRSYFMDMASSQVNGSSVHSLFTFPFTINNGSPIPISEYMLDNVIDLYNDSENEVGTVIDIDVVSDISSILIRNTGTGETFALTHAFEAGDHITIDTIKGQKSVTLLRDGVYTNLFSAMQRGSVFFQLQTGDNFFAYVVDGDASNNGDIMVMFTYRKIFRGV